MLLSFSPSDHPIMHATKTIGEINESLITGRHHLFEGRPNFAHKTGFDHLRVVLNDHGQRTLVEVKSKRRLHSRRQMWVFDVQIFKCVCSPWEYLEIAPPNCTCQIPKFQGNENPNSSCFCNICRYLKLTKREKSEDNHERHVMECVCPECATESKIVSISGPSTVRDLDKSGRFGNFRERRNADCEVFAPLQIEDYKPCNPLHFVEYSCSYCYNKSRIETVVSCNGTADNERPGIVWADRGPDQETSTGKTVTASAGRRELQGSLGGAMIRRRSV